MVRGIFGVHAGVPTGDLLHASFPVSFAREAFEADARSLVASSGPLLADSLGFEVRLDDGNDSCDVGVGAVSPASLRSFGPRLETLASESPDWGHLTAAARRAIRDRDPLLGGTFLEFDQQVLGFSTPSLFLRFRSPPERHSFGLACEYLPPELASLARRGLEPVESLLASQSLEFVGLMHSRTTAQLRLSFSVDGSCVADCMDVVGLRISSALENLVASYGHVGFALGIGQGGLVPACGLEFRPRASLDVTLVGLGLAVRRRVEQVHEWLAAGLPGYRRAISHYKVSVDSSGNASAKAYVSVCRVE